MCAHTGSLCLPVLCLQLRLREEGLLVSLKQSEKRAKKTMKAVRFLGVAVFSAQYHKVPPLYEYAAPMVRYIQSTEMKQNCCKAYSSTKYNLY